MAQDEKELLEKTYKLSEENNNILRKMRRSAFYGRIFKVLYLIVALVLATSLYYVIQPYFDKVVNIYNNVMVGAEQLKKVNDSVPTIPGGLNTDAIKSVIESLNK